MSKIADALKDAALLSVAQTVEGENKSFKHLLTENGRQSLAQTAGYGIAKSIKNERLGAIAGSTVARLIAGEKVSGKDVLRTAIGMFLSRKGTF